jgi:hypothetical protein
MRVAIFRFFGISATLSLLAICLVIVVFVSNEVLRQQLAQRQDEINQSLALGTIYSRLVISLDIVAARDNDERIRALLAQRGVSFDLRPPAKDKDGAAGKEEAREAQ